jgi:hypothetical protein
VNINPLGDLTRRDLRHKQNSVRSLHDGILRKAHPPGIFGGPGRRFRLAQNIDCNPHATTADVSEALQKLPRNPST